VSCRRDRPFDKTRKKPVGRGVHGAGTEPETPEGPGWRGQAPQGPTRPGPERGCAARARTGLGDCASKGCAERGQRRGASRPAHPASAPRRPRPRATLGGITNAARAPLSAAAPGRPRRWRGTVDPRSSWTGMAPHDRRPGGRWREKHPGRGEGGGQGATPKGPKAGGLPARTTDEHRQAGSSLARFGQGEL